MNIPWPTIELTTPAGAKASVLEHGAHVCAWHTTRKKPWIFTSTAAVFEEGKAIRGGVPIVFPQFNTMGSGPKHGFLRNTQWALTQKPTQTHNGCECALKVTSNDQTKALWPHDFEARFKLVLTDTKLSMTLSIINTGQSAFEFNSALHTYFAIEELSKTSIDGLDNTAYWDNGTPFTERKTYTHSALHLSGAIDRVMFDINGALKLVDQERTLQITQPGFTDAVIWNPGEKGAKAISDLANNEYPSMLCVEAANIDSATRLEPGEHWEGTQHLHELAS